MDSPDDDKINITFYSRVRGKNTGVNYKSTVRLGVVGHNFTKQKTLLSEANHQTRLEFAIGH